MDYKELKKTLLLEPSKNDDRYKDVFNKVLKNIKVLQNIDTHNVEPSHWPYKLKRTTLRNDDVIRTIDKKEFAKNTTFTDGYIVIEEGKDE